MIKQNISYFKTYVALFIFLFVNFIFCIKYFSRITPFYMTLSLFFVFSYFLLWKFQKELFYIQKTLKYILTCYFIFCVFLFYKIPVESLNVDRWSVITSFWDAFLEGKYVYFAKSNVGNPPEPMPFYFVLALPFYLAGELGFFSISGLIAFYLIIRININSKLLHATSTLLLITSIFYLWEIICRSNIFLNGTIILFVLTKLLKIIEFDIKKIIKIGILIGLALSTRNVFIIPFIISFVHLTNHKILNFKNIFLISITALFTFVVTFIPFTWNHVDEFKIMNPFIIQSTALMPFKLTLIFIFISCLTGLFCKSVKDVYFYSGFVLFITIIGYYLYHFQQEGFQKTFFDSIVNISYFILCMPFVMYYLIIQRQESILWS